MKKTCLITGGSRGIGLAIAHRLANAGYHLALAARNQDVLEKAARQLRSAYPDVEIIVCPVDLRSKDAIRSFAEMVRARWDHVNVLINNAGAFTPGSVLSEEEGSLEFMMETNAYSAYYMSRAVIDLIRKSKAGHIFNICSIASIKAYPEGGAYGISKYAMLGFSKNLREELKTEGIKVTSVLPGATWTESWEGSGVSADRIMTADDIAEVVHSALKMGPQAVVEEIVIRPQLGDL